MCTTSLYAKKLKVKSSKLAYYDYEYHFESVHKVCTSTVYDEGHHLWSETLMPTFFVEFFFIFFFNVLLLAFLIVLSLGRKCSLPPIGITDPISFLGSKTRPPISNFNVGSLQNQLIKDYFLQKLK